MQEVGNLSVLLTPKFSFFHCYGFTDTASLKLAVITDWFTSSHIHEQFKNLKTLFYINFLVATCKSLVNSYYHRSRFRTATNR